MSEEVNPFQITETPAAPIKPLATHGTPITETMLFYLKGASPWLKFISILGFIGAGLTALGGIRNFVSSSFIEQIWDNTSDFEVFGGFFNGSIIGLFYMGYAVAMFFPSLFMYRFGDKIRSYLITGAEQDLEQAFKNNKSYLKCTGIILIICLVFTPIIIIYSIARLVELSF